MSERKVAVFVQTLVLLCAVFCDQMRHKFFFARKLFTTNSTQVVYGLRAVQLQDDHPGKLFAKNFVVGV